MLSEYSQSDNIIDDLAQTYEKDEEVEEMLPSASHKDSLMGHLQEIPAEEPESV